MPFLGNTPAQGFAESITKDSFTPNGSTTAFTLSKTAATNSISVFVGNVRQEPTSSYSVSGTTLNMTEAPSTGTGFYVLHSQGTIESTTVLPAGSVVTNSLASSIDLSGKTVTYGLVNTDMPTGSVLQVVQGVNATQLALTTTSYTDSGLSASITPSSTSNKILVMWNTQGALTNASTRGWGSRILRNSAIAFTDTTNYRTYGDGNTGDIRLTISQSHLDSPSTTSAITYKVQVSPHNTSSTTFNQGNVQTQITLMEIKG